MRSSWTTENISPDYNGNSSLSMRVLQYYFTEFNGRPPNKESQLQTCSGTQKLWFCKSATPDRNSSSKQSQRIVEFAQLHCNISSNSHWRLVTRSIWRCRRIWTVVRFLGSQWERRTWTNPRPRTEIQTRHKSPSHSQTFPSPASQSRWFPTLLEYVLTLYSGTFSAQETRIHPLRSSDTRAEWTVPIDSRPRYSFVPWE